MRAGVKAMCTAGVVAVVSGLLAPPAAVSAEAPSTVAQELTLVGLGMDSQTLYGTLGVIEVAFPPPAGHLATGGSFVRVFFSHSQSLAPGSSMLLAVNGQPLTGVALESGTAAGGVLELRVPATLLDEVAPNRLQVRFELRPTAGMASTAYGRLESPTLIHYELAGPGGAPPGLEAYPYSLLTAGAPRSALGLVLPVTPAAKDLTPALRLLADLGRRAASQRVRPQVVTADQLAWLAAGGTGALLVGPVDSLPAAPPVLEAAGWRRSPAGWTAPGGAALKAEDGLVLAAVSPWDRRSHLVLVTGGTAGAVAKAAAALMAATSLAGPAAVVTEAPSRGGSTPAGVTRLSLLSPRALGGLGPGRFRAAVTFTAAAADPDDFGSLEVTVPGFTAPMPSSSVEADLNGSRVASTALTLSGTRPSLLRASFPGRLLRSGRNVLAVEISIGQGPPGAPTPYVQGGGLTVGGEDATTALISPPASHPANPDLRLLPFPFLAGSRPTQVLVADGTTSTLAAAAQAMVALGSRTTEPPTALSVAYATGWRPAPESGDLIVVGSLPPDSTLGAIIDRSPVSTDRSGQVTLRQDGGDVVRLTTTLGAIEELRPDELGGQTVLWVGGTGPDPLGAAAAALYDARLSGRAQLVDLTGRAWSPLVRAQIDVSTGPGFAALAAVLAAMLLLGVVVLQFVHPRRSAL